jgi:hypothetical protein
MFRIDTCGHRNLILATPIAYMANDIKMPYSEVMH